ncbi:MAG: serine/threonine-protein kinase [Bryobacter sp.]|nr:serine/threonine-protein kinase [Bryobacter sp.]
MDTLVDERWQYVKQLLHKAVELPAAERGAYVSEVAGTDPELAAELESLLASFDDAEAFLEDPPVQLTAPGDTIAGRWIGEYQVVRLLAQGGMGSVYEAVKEVDGVALRVAVKIIRFAAHSPYLNQRFRLERQILARLQHEYVVRLLDGGVTGDGLSYLVTEYVEGQNLQEWLEEAQPTLEDRLQIFLRICEGLAAAHRSLIVHGDLKPSNILVNAQGQPKLLDFGIARLLKTQEESEDAGGTATLTMAPALTPWWASPEQLRGEPLVISCDCYALGRVLFFLLTGKTPFDFSGMSTGQMVDHLRKTSPPKPSQIAANPAYRDDLDNIVQKALEFEPAHRYRSADAMAEDIRLHLDSRPISARPYTWPYRAQKFIRRNRAWVIAATAATFAIVSAAGAALYQANEARRNYESSQQRYEQLRGLASSLIFEIDDTLLQLSGATPVRAQLARSALHYLDQLAREESKDLKLMEELASAYEKIGDIQGRPGSQNLGMTGDALQSYRKAEAIRERLRATHKDPQQFQVANENLANNFARISAALRAIGDTQGALRYERKALGIREALYQGDPTNAARKRALATNLSTLSSSLSQLGDWEGVYSTRRDALKFLEELVASDPTNREDMRLLSLGLARMGSIEMYLGNTDAALGHYQRALQLEKTVLATDPSNVLYRLGTGWSHNNLGVALVRGRRYADALEHYRTAQLIFRTVIIADEKDFRARTLLQTCRVNMAKALTEMGRPQESLPLALDVVREREKLSAMNPANAGALGEVAEAHFAAGLAQAGLARKAEALQSYRQAFQILDQLRREGRDNFAMREDIAAINEAHRKLAGKPLVESLPASNSPAPTATAR